MTRIRNSGRTLLLKLVMLFIASTSSATELLSDEPVSLRVLSYNIHHGEGIDGILDLERIADVILSVKPDLVALQEVDQGASRTGGVDQPTELARLTSMHVVFAANIELQGGHYGNAILSRFPVAGHQNHLLPRIDQGEQRGVLAAEISLAQPDGAVLLLATHFDHRRDDAERVQSARTVNRLVQKTSRPALLMGDLNDVIGSATLNQLDAEWVRTNDKPLPTIPVAEPKRQIDFILFRPRDTWSVNETRVLTEAVASDHRAIFSVLELRVD